MTTLFVACILIAIAVIALLFLFKDALLGGKDKMIVFAVAIIALMLAVVFIVIANKGSELGSENASPLTESKQERLYIEA